MCLALFEYSFSICLVCILHVRARAFGHCISMGCFDQEQKPPSMHRLDTHIKQIQQHLMLHEYIYTYAQHLKRLNDLNLATRITSVVGCCFSDF